VFAWIVLLAATFVVLFPIWWTVTASFKNPVDMATRPPRYVPFLNFEPTLDAWKSVFGAGSMIYRLVANSLIIAVSSSALAITIGSLAAYSLSRFEFKRLKNNYIAFFDSFEQDVSASGVGYTFLPDVQVS